MSVNHIDLVKQQIEYYQARAYEFDEWFLRHGRYDMGKKLNTLWFDEIEKLKQVLREFHPSGDILELACGTGWWTQELIRYATHITAVDASAEVIAINKSKVGTKKVSFVQADIFSLRPAQRYDVLFFSFWLSHIPENKFESFWNFVYQSLKPTGRVFFIDNLQSEGKPHKTGSINIKASATSIRKLKDGRTFTIVKLFYTPEELEGRLGRLGWDMYVQQTRKYFIYGSGLYKKQQ